jgi:hypothetical protein
MKFYRSPGEREVSSHVQWEAVLLIAIALIATAVILFK